MQLCVLGNEIQWDSLISWIFIFIFIMCWAPHSVLNCRVCKCISAFLSWKVHLILTPEDSFSLRCLAVALKGSSYSFCVPQQWHTSKLLSAGYKKGILNYVFSLILVASPKWLLEALHLDDFPFTFVHSQLYLLVNHSPCCSLPLTEFMKMIK